MNSLLIFKKILFLGVGCICLSTILAVTQIKKTYEKSYFLVKTNLINTDFLLFGKSTKDKNFNCYINNDKYYVSNCNLYNLGQDSLKPVTSKNHLNSIELNKVQWYNTLKNNGYYLLEIYGDNLKNLSLNIDNIELNLKNKNIKFLDFKPVIYLGSDLNNILFDYLLVNFNKVDHITKDIFSANEFYKFDILINGDKSSPSVSSLNTLNSISDLNTIDYFLINKNKVNELLRGENDGIIIGYLKGNITKTPINYFLINKK